LVAQLRAVLAAQRAGQAGAPARQVLPLAADGVLLLMPAADAEIAVTKFVTVHPGNAGSDLPVVQADLLVMEARTGRRLLWLDGSVVTARRTAALSLLAAQHLAPAPAGPLLLIGCGAQGRAHLEAFTEGLGVREVYIAARRPAHAEALAAEARAGGLAAQAVADPATVLDLVTLIITATTSATPVLPAAVRPDSFIAAIGAYRSEQAELPAALVQRAQIVVDTLEGAQAEAGDLIQAGVAWDRVTALADALDRPRPVAGPVVFKSVGHALWDLAAARLAWQGMPR
jgi:ornithine cyclodeaminase